MAQCKCGTYSPYWKELRGRTIAPAMNLNSCINCGVVLSDHPDSYVKPTPGFMLGDKVEKVLKVSGVADAVQKIAKVVGVEDCGCAARKEKLNTFKF
jgi:hypothetical protein